MGLSYQNLFLYWSSLMINSTLWPLDCGHTKTVSPHVEKTIQLYYDCNVHVGAFQNFLALCASDYYNGCSFHRNIKAFMVQTGDPTGKQIYTKRNIKCC